jgi:predicted outer membrane repeat protein
VGFIKRKTAQGPNHIQSSTGIKTVYFLEDPVKMDMVPLYSCVPTQLYLFFSNFAKKQGGEIACKQEQLY